MNIYVELFKNKELIVNKNDLIAAISTSAGLSKTDATRCIESIIDTI